MCVSVFPVCKTVCVMFACDTDLAKSPWDRLNMSKKFQTSVRTQSVPGRRHSAAQLSFFPLRLMVLQPVLGADILRVRRYIG